MPDNHNPKRLPSARDNSPPTDAESKPSSAGVPETKNSHPPDHLGVMRERMTRSLDHELQRMENSEIDRLSDRHNSMLTQLAST